jgi:hypothetical protein
MVVAIHLNQYYWRRLSFGENFDEFVDVKDATGAVCRHVP